MLDSSFLFCLVKLCLKFPNTINIINHQSEYQWIFYRSLLTWYNAKYLQTQREIFLDKLINLWRKEISVLASQYLLMPRPTHPPTSIIKRTYSRIWLGMSRVVWPGLTTFRPSHHLDWDGQLRSPYITCYHPGSSCPAWNRTWEDEDVTDHTQISQQSELDTSRLLVNVLLQYLRSFPSSILRWLF